MSSNTPARRGRPPRSGEQRDTRAQLVRRGIEILTEQGFARTGIEHVLRQVGVPKGSFYHYFTSKADFGHAVIDGYADYFAAKLNRWLLNTTRAPLERLLDFAEDGKRGLERHGFRRGCLIGNLGQELGGTDDGFREHLESVFGDWQQRVAHCLDAARAVGQLDRDADPSRLAEVFWTGWEGAILRAKLERSTRPIDSFIEFYIQGLPQPRTQTS